MEAVNNSSTTEEVITSIKEVMKGVAEKFIFTPDNNESRYQYKDMMCNSLMSHLPYEATHLKINNINRRIGVDVSLILNGNTDEDNRFQFAALIPYLDHVDEKAYGIYVYVLGSGWTRLFNAKYTESTEVGIVGYSCEVTCVSSEFDEVMHQLGYDYQTKFSDIDCGSYSITSNGGCIDITEVSEGTWYVNRIFTRPEHRNKGYATSMMKELIKQATKHKAVLMLEVNPYGDLNYDQLVQWYEEFGFEWNTEHNAMYK